MRTFRTNAISYTLEGHTRRGPPNMFHVASGLPHVDGALRLERRLWVSPQTGSVAAVLTVVPETRTSLTGTEMLNYPSRRDYS
jgi:hypothetical protein